MVSIIICKIDLLYKVCVFYLKISAFQLVCGGVCHFYNQAGGEGYGNFLGFFATLKIISK
jgi:hypothetical protein